MTDFATTIGMVLKQKDGSIASTTPDASVYQAIEMMAEKQVGALLVMEAGVLLGIISERDYARKVILQGRSSKETQVVGDHEQSGDHGDAAAYGGRVHAHHHEQPHPASSGGGERDVCWGGFDRRPGELGDLGAGDDDPASGGLHLRATITYVVSDSDRFV